MHIKIAERLHPFSHQSGTHCLIPKTTWELQAFPTLLRFRDMQSTEYFEMVLPFKGPIKGFTLEQNLEKGFIHIFGMSQEGYIDCQIAREKNSLKLICTKIPEVECHFLGKSLPLRKGESIILPITLKDEQFLPTSERLSLGMHKSQDWVLVQRRMDLSEIFPIWLRLAALIPQRKLKELPPVGTLLLLKECKKALDQEEKNTIKPLFTALFQTAFQGILSPRLTDEQFLGIIPPFEGEIPATLSPLLVLQESAKLIRELFFKEEGEKIFLLPCLPTEMHSGRFIGIKTAAGDEIHLEWSKKILKKVIYRSATEKEITLELQRPLKSFRVRYAQKDHGSRVLADDPLFLGAGQTLYLDRFQK